MKIRNLIFIILSIIFISYSFINLNIIVNSVNSGKDSYAEQNQIHDNSKNFILQDDTWTYNITLNELNLAGRTYYDLQSNGCPREIWQDSAQPQNMHATFIVDPIGVSPLFPDVRTKYFFSNDTGNTWSNLGNVPNIRTSFPSINGLSNGSAIIVNHSTNTGGQLYSNIYIDSTAGSGNFSLCTPPLIPPSNELPVWLEFTPSQNIATLNKIIFAVQNSSNNGFNTNGLTSYNPCSFGSYTSYNTFGTVSNYRLAKGYNGKIGIVFISSIPNQGSLYFMESTNNGVSFGSAIQIWTPNYTTGDSMGVFKSLDIAYLGIIPKVVFGVVKLNNAGGYFSKETSKIYFWSPNINGGNPLLIDSTSGLIGTNQNNTNDFFASSCRPVIGVSSSDNYLFLAWNRARLDTSSSGNNFFDVYCTYSSNGGASWRFPFIKVTNNFGAIRDYRYISMSPISYNQPGSYNIHLVFQYDSIPGSFINGASRSLARMMYSRIKIYYIQGIKKINSEIPQNFSLYQNIPNPFNPITKIKFEIASVTKLMNKKVKVIVFDVLGNEIKTLVNQQLKPGTYEVVWDAENYPSGVYLYEIIIGDYFETRKMVLLK